MIGDFNAIRNLSYDWCVTVDAMFCMMMVIIYSKFNIIESLSPPHNPYLS